MLVSMGLRGFVGIPFMRTFRQTSGLPVRKRITLGESQFKDIATLFKAMLVNDSVEPSGFPENDIETIINGWVNEDKAKHGSPSLEFASPIHEWYV